MLYDDPVTGGTPPGSAFESVESAGSYWVELVSVAMSVELVPCVRVAADARFSATCSSLCVGES